MLELALGKALARCAFAAGYRVLIDYLDDHRAALAEQAHSNLIRIAGRDFGKQRKLWTEWLATARLEPNPLTEDLDIVYEREILVQA